jgi:hypothetical protein
LVALDIKIAKGYQLLVNISPISLVLLAFKFHKNLSLEKRVVRRDATIDMGGCREQDLVGGFNICLSYNQLPIVVEFHKKYKVPRFFIGFKRL